MTIIEEECRLWIRDEIPGSDLRRKSVVSGHIHFIILQCTWNRKISVDGPAGWVLNRNIMPDEDAIKFECPHCAQPIESSLKNAGMAVNCPTCGKPFQVPSPNKPLSTKSGEDAFEWFHSPIKRWIVIRQMILLVGLAGLLWWDYQGWESKGSQFMNENTTFWFLIIPFLFWAGIAWECTPDDEHGRFLAVLGCGIMVFAWWGLHSIPCLIIGGVVLLFGLTKIITDALKKQRN
ncbi:MAG: hypothetical protein ABSA83_18080 [Verrucomicrobiota bacterium]|jgi:predicted RNA-binding Zn-ribbon protein involved in translation (DUF1610 family)